MDGKRNSMMVLARMMFTHFGVTGPLILKCQQLRCENGTEKELSMFIDLKPALSKEQLDHRILRDFEEAKQTV